MAGVRTSEAAHGHISQHLRKINKILQVDGTSTRPTPSPLQAKVLHLNQQQFAETITQQGASPIITCTRDNRITTHLDIKKNSNRVSLCFTNDGEAGVVSLRSPCSNSLPSVRGSVSPSGEQTRQAVHEWIHTSAEGRAWGGGQRVYEYSVTPSLSTTFPACDRDVSLEGLKSVMEEREKKNKSR